MRKIEIFVMENEIVGVCGNMKLWILFFVIEYGFYIDKYKIYYSVWILIVYSVLNSKVKELCEN